MRARVLVEELLSRPDGVVPDDLKLFVMAGIVNFAQGEHVQDFFDRDRRPLDLTGGHPRSAVPPARPERYEQAVALAERLGAGTDVVRVDLFCLPDRVVVGELTSSPAGGDSPFGPPEWDAHFGAPWTVPRRYC